MKKKVFFLLFLLSAFVAVNASVIEGINDEGSNISIYPMPVLSTANVSSPSAIMKVEVYNILGTKVAERDGQGAIDFSRLPRGFYLIKILTPNGEVVKRIQKQ